MTVLAATRAWMRQNCPLIDKNDRFNAGYLGAKAGAYALTASGESHVQDICGATKRTVQLLFLARLPFGEALADNLCAVEFFSELAAWLEARESAHEYPQGIDGDEVCRLTAQNAGLVLSAEAGNACYQLQMTLQMEEVQDA